MKRIIESVYASLEKSNWYAALFVSLTLPDICSALEYGKSSGKKYADWFESNLIDYRDSLSGNDCYALRCALLHTGKDDISDQSKKEVLDHYLFLSEGPHKSLLLNNVYDGEKRSFLQLNVQNFCRDICKAVEAWLESKSDNEIIQDRLRETIEIHEQGYVYKGFIKFG